jgi:hypothetical protein
MLNQVKKKKKKKKVEARRGSRPKKEEPPKKFSWGGRREGSGRKPKGDKAGVSHRQRPEVTSRQPVKVTLEIAKGLGSLREKGAYRALRDALALGSEASGFRLLRYSVERAKLHLIVEAADVPAMARAMQGLGIRVARSLNRAWERNGKVFADRYDAKPLKTPAEVRRAMADAPDTPEKPPALAARTGGPRARPQGAAGGKRASRPAASGRSRRRKPGTG